MMANVRRRATSRASASVVAAGSLTDIVCAGHEGRKSGVSEIVRDGPLVASCYCRAGGVVSTMRRPMRNSLRLRQVLYAGAAIAFVAAPPRCADLDDGVMVARRELLTGNSYTVDTWDKYWEGALERTNANIGTITTKANVLHANYGLTDRLNVIGMVPYVWTKPVRASCTASRVSGHHPGREIEGHRAIVALAGTCGAFAVVRAGIPLTDYNPELLPLSIGIGSTRVSWRGTVNYQMPAGWFVNGSAAYIWRSQVQLDRPLFLHRRRVHDERSGRHAERVRQRPQRRLHEAQSDGRGFPVAAGHARWRRHPASGHAVRLQPHELLEGGRHGDAADSEGGRLRGAGLRGADLCRAQRRAVHHAHRRDAVSLQREASVKAWRATLLLAAAVLAAIAQPVDGLHGHRARCGRRQLAHDRPHRADADRRGAAGASDFGPTIRRSSRRSRTRRAPSRPSSAKAIEYWSSGGVLRWNEILLGLVSRFNLPPAPMPDNSYPVPDANNPFADPNFPFANPPYASRAYSYVTVAQYDALKAAWYYKFLYNRPAPSKVDSAVKRLGPASDLPAYPSEDAVLSGVTAELLKLLSRPRSRRSR